MKRNAVITAILIALLSLSGISVYAARRAVQQQSARKQEAAQTSPAPKETTPAEPETTAPAETTQPPAETTEPETAPAEEPTVLTEPAPAEETTLPAETTAVPEETTSAEPETAPAPEETLPEVTETLPPETEPAPPPETEAPAPALLGEEAARLLAFQYAGVSADSAVMKKTELDHEHGRQIYEVKFDVPGDAEYEVELDAVTGELLDLDLDALEEETQPAEPEPSLLSVEDAKQTALVDAGFSAEAVTFGKAKFEREHGRSLYEIKFYTADETEYEYEIDAVTGAVLKAEIDD